MNPAVVLSLGVVYLIWSSTYLALRYVVEVFPALLSGGLRYFVAGCIVFVMLRLKKEPMPKAREWFGAAPVGFLLFVLGNGFVGLAQRRGVSSSVSAVAIGVMPIFAALMSLRSYDRPTGRQWSGLALGLSGVVLMGFGDLRATPVGLVFLLFAAIGWAAGTHLSKHLPMPRGLMAAAAQMMTGGALTFLTGLAVGERWPTVPFDHAMRAWLAFGYMVIFGSVVAFSAYTYLVRNTSPAVATSYAYVNPVLAVVMGIVIGHERVALSTFCAAAFVVVGVAFIVTKRPAGPRTRAA